MVMTRNRIAGELVPSSTIGRLAGLLARQIKVDGYSETGLPGVVYMRSSRYYPSRPLIYDRGLCIVVQGRKVGRCGPHTFAYDADNFLVMSVPLPVECEVFATAEEPVLGLRIDIDPIALTELMLEMNERDLPAPAVPTPHGLYATTLTEEMRGALLRLVESFERPADAKILGPSILREIMYRTLRTEQAGALRALAARHTHFNAIAKALQVIHSDITSDLSVEDLAAEAHMSASAFHEHFKAVTATTPLQYVKTIRLHKARVMMIQQGLGAAQAAVEVGYESASQFSREFKRLFGATPAQEASAARAMLVAV